jgi:hypothetical protein
VFADGYLDNQRNSRAHVKTHAYDLGITDERAGDRLRMSDAMINVHRALPAGAQKKDGSRVGVAVVCSPLLGVDLSTGSRC